MRINVFEGLRDMLPADRIAADLRTVLSEGDPQVELEGKPTLVPPDAELDVIARGLHAYEVEIGFRDHCRVLVAIGGVRSVEHGVITAGICFATLWYSADLELITVDFAKEMP